MSGGPRAFDEEAVQLFGARMTMWRDYAGLSQYELARATGIDGASISRLETGKRQPSLTQILIIAKALDISPSTLLDDDPPHNAKGD